MWRSSGDVDVLVDPADCAEARNVLESLGAHIPPFEHREKSFVAVLERVEVDLHRRVVAGPVGYLAQHGWFEAERVVSLDGIDVPALDRERALLHACLNALSNEWYERPRALLDVALLMSHPPLDLAMVRALTEQWCVGTIIFDALRLAAGPYDIEVAPVVRELEALPRRPSARLVCAIDAQRRRAYSTRLLADAYLSGPTWRARVDLVARSRSDRPNPFGLPITASPIRSFRRYATRSPHQDPRG